jgi:UPF0176 protein
MTTQKPQPIQVSTFYKFQKIAPEALTALKNNLESWAAEGDLRGLVLIGPEGFNATVCGASEPMEAFKKKLVNIVEDQKIWFKDSFADFKPFTRFKVKIKDEIVTIGRPGLVPDKEINFHLDPNEWHQAMEEEDVIVVDTRNAYETEIGKFKNAVDLKIDDFQEFTKKFVDLGVDKNKKILIYCTGGIRCEKAILELHEQGYKNVYQLNGGILNYIEQKPKGLWEGECFVFDHRVAVDSNLEPSKRYGLCPHCGQPGEEKIECRQCGTEQIVCKKCLDASPDKHTCSKNCANHSRLGNKSTRPHLDALRIRR